jgi:hypothetical protein
MPLTPERIALYRLILGILWSTVERAVAVTTNGRGMARPGILREGLTGLTVAKGF